ncbi:DMT family transporter [Nocardia ninae]|uniref:Multidrug transporter n=1 Tax=Nocardia ninae NBRC 108245 TaxID=1210091 RepID=A0A511MJX1_9NOCA|nr:DMT family transporter [Nocardia ninae]GEM40417.1 multidrug transporter [Nocardia ninae NBRC 108245]
MIAIALALGAAFGWGTSDFLGGLKSRTLPLLSVLLISQSTALVLVTVFTLVRGGGPPEPASLGYAALAGLAETAAVAALYRGLAVGSISIVAAVASTAPVVPLLGGLLFGEVPGALQLAGLAVALVGLVVASLKSEQGGKAGQVLPSIGFGLLAAVGFGTFFLAMDTASTGDIGWALLTARLTAVGLIGVVILVGRQRVSVPSEDIPSIALIGVLIVAADALYATASTLGMVGIVAVLGALHTLVTIALARIFLNERLGRPQQVGVGAALVGVLAIASG